MRELTIILLFCTSCLFLNAQRVGIGTSAPDPSAQLDVKDTRRGILIPRIAIQDLSMPGPVIAPTTSLLVYNTNTNTETGFYYWNGLQWVKLVDGIVDDHDWLEVGTTEPADDVTDNIYTMGNVGIGTLTPSHKLDIVGDVEIAQSNKLYFTNFLNEPKLTLFEGVGNVNIAPDIHMAEQGLIAAESNLFLNIDSDSSSVNSHFSILTDDKTHNGTLLMRVEETGHVGFGVINPEENLVVNGITRLRGINTLGASDQRLVMEIGFNPISNDVAAVGPDRHFRILTETDLVSTGTDFLVFEALDANNVDQDGGFVFRGRNNSGIKRDIISFRGNGRVGIGTNNPLSSLHISNNLSGNTVRLEDDDKVWLTGISTTNTWGVWEDTGASVNNRFIIRELGNVGIGTTAPSARLSVNGTANKPGGGSWAVFSDRRAKENIHSYSRGLDEILQINPVSFSYKEEFDWGTDTHVGLIAQEVEPIVPSMISEKEIQNLKDFKEVDPNELTYMLINAVKEQQDMIEQLQLENNQLKSTMVEQNNIQASTNQELLDLIKQLQVDVGALKQ